MNVDSEDKKHSHAMPAPPKTLAKVDKQPIPDTTSPNMKQTRNTESPKPPLVKALFQQTPKISSCHAIKDTRGSNMPPGTPAPLPAQTKTAEGVTNMKVGTTAVSTKLTSLEVDQDIMPSSTNANHTHTVKEPQQKLPTDRTDEHQVMTRAASSGETQCPTINNTSATTTTAQVDNQTPMLEANSDQTTSTTPVQLAWEAKETKKQHMEDGDKKEKDYTENQ